MKVDGSSLLIITWRCVRGGRLYTGGGAQGNTRSDAVAEQDLSAGSMYILCVGGGRIVGSCWRSNAMPGIRGHPFPGFAGAVCRSGARPRGVNHNRDHRRRRHDHRRRPGAGTATGPMLLGRLSRIPPHARCVTCSDCAYACRVLIGARNPMAVPVLHGAHSGQQQKDRHGAVQGRDPLQAWRHAVRQLLFFPFFLAHFTFCRLYTTPRAPCDIPYFRT